MCIRDSVLSGPYVIEKLYEVTDGDAVISTDVGQHQMWTAQYYKFKQPRQLLTSGGLGTMGYGLGACIGAKMGVPDKTCLLYTSHGKLNLFNAKYELDARPIEEGCQCPACRSYSRAYQLKRNIKTLNQRT